MIPQYFIITLSEVFVSVTGIEWAYTEAPTCMKSIVNAFWVLTTCVGNLIDLAIVSIKFTRIQSTEYLIFSGLMTIAAIIFTILAVFYYGYSSNESYRRLDDMDMDVQVEERSQTFKIH